MDKEIWRALEKHQTGIAELRIEKLFEDDPERFDNWTIQKT